MDLLHLMKVLYFTLWYILYIIHVLYILLFESLEPEYVKLASCCHTQLIDS